MSKSSASSSSPYENVMMALDEIDTNLDKAEKELKKISRLRGVEAVDIGKAQREFNQFKAEYQQVKEDLKKSAVSMKKTEHENAMFSKLEAFATKWLAKLDQSLGSPGSKIQNNVIFSAVRNVISSVCTEMVCSFKHTVAAGKLAASVFELGSAIHDKMSGKDQEPEVPQPAGSTKRRDNPLDELNESLDMVSQYMQNAKQDLQGVSGPNKPEAGKALEMLESFSTGFDRVKTDIKRETAGVPEARDKFYKTTWVGKMENFAQEWLGKVAHSSESAPNSKILKAAGNVVKCACGVATSAVDKTVATGKVIASVVKLGVTVRQKTVSQGAARSI